MKTGNLSLRCFLGVALALLLAGAPAAAATIDLTTTLQKALFEEEANHNLDAAIQLYQSVVTQFDKDRKLAATAVFRLAECYRKQGNTNDATAQYERVLREFADQTQLTGLSRQCLATLGATPPPSTPGTLSSAARQEQKRLLEEEVKLVEKKLSSQQKQIETGVTSPDELLPTQRELLQLKRKIAALDSGGPVGVAESDGGIQAAMEARADAAALETKLLLLNQMKPQDLRVAVQQEYPNPLLTSLMQKLAESEQNLAAMSKEFGPNHSKVVEETTRAKTINEQIDVQVKAVLAGLAARRKEAEARAAALALAPAELASETRGPRAAQPGTTAEEEEIRRIQVMTKDSPDLINAKPDNGLAPLNSAASKGHLVVAQFLLEHGADIEVKNPGDGWLPIHYAANFGHKSIVELLLGHKARVDATTGDGKTPLHLAAEKGFRSVVEALLERGANVNAKAADVTPLHLAVGNGFRAVAESLLAKGADPNVSAPYVRVARENKSGTPLHLAVGRGDLPMAELLVTHEANPNITDRSGATALDLAANAGNSAMAEFLLAHGAKVDAKNEDSNVNGWTALHYAVMADQNAVVNVLLKHKADPNAPIQTGFSVNRPRWNGPGQPTPAAGSTPVMLAATKGYLSIVESLLAAKADPNVKSANGDSAVGNVMTYIQPPERAKILASLLEHGADPNARDPLGRTALMVAAESRDKQSLELLLSHKADTNAKTPQSEMSALHFLALSATFSGATADVPPMARELIAAGADPNVQDANGRTPLKYLSQHISSPAPGISAVARDVADLLRQAGAAEDLARMDVIEVRRPSASYSAAVFWKGTNDYNQFTLFELLAAHYGFVSARSGRETENPPQFDSASHTLSSSLKFPDLANVSIRRPKPDRTDWTARTINLSAILGLASTAQSCIGDEGLQWGDVVEISEVDHPISAVWQGLPREQLAVLERCLSRGVSLTVKGSTTNLVLSPKVLPLGLPPPRFTLVPVLYQSGMLRASSDLSRVKVTRRDPTSGQSYTMSFDCSPSLPSDRLPYLWLRDGDSIEVPEKP
ncbi:MAG TPA: ankyrin repeat domain-containing protein [Verrucomicrobiae bacterium]